MTTAMPTTTTRNGYRVKDALAALEKELLAKEDAHDPNSACSLAAEVFCSPSHAHGLVAFLVDHVAAKRCSTCLPQMVYLDAALSYLAGKTLEARRLKQDAHSDADVRKCLCRCLLTIMPMRVKALKVDVDVSALRRKIRAGDQARKHVQQALEGCSVALDSPVALALVQLADVAIMDEKTDRVLSTVMCLVLVHKSQPVVPGLDKWEGVAKHVKPSLRNHIQFVMWRLAMILAAAVRDKEDGVAKYVTALFGLYVNGLNKSNMDDRVNLLLYAYAAINRRGVRHTMPPEPSCMQAALDRVDVLFQDIICQPHQTHQTHQLNISSNAGEHKQAIKNHESILRMYTLSDSSFGIHTRLDMDVERDLRKEFETPSSMDVNNIKSIAISRRSSDPRVNSDPFHTPKRAQ